MRLTGKGKNTNAVGAIVTVTSGGVTQSRIVQSGTSYVLAGRHAAALRSRRAHGRGERRGRWPDGTVTSLANVKADQVVDVRQPR